MQYVRVFFKPTSQVVRLVAPHVPERYALDLPYAGDGHWMSVIEDAEAFAADRR